MLPTGGLDELLNKLTNGSLEERVQAGFVVSWMVGEAAISPLIDLLKKSENQDVWWLVAQALGDIGDKRAVEPLIELMRNSLVFDDLFAQKYSAWALGKLKDPRAVDVLLEALHHQKFVTSEDGTVFDETDGETIEAVEWALTEIGDLRALEPILERMIADNYQDGDELTKWGEPALKLLLAELNGENSVRRAIAASFLDEFVDQQGVELLINVLQNDTTLSVRTAAAYYLVELQDPRTFKALLTALTDPDKRIREYAAEALGNLNDTRAINALKKATQDESPSVRQSAQWALQNMPKLSTE